MTTALVLGRQQVSQWRDLYPADPNSYFIQLSVGASAILLAFPSHFGTSPALSCVCSVLNAVACGDCAAVPPSNAGPGPACYDPWLAAFRPLSRFAFVFDMFRSRPAETSFAGESGLVLAAATRRPWTSDACLPLPPRSRFFSRGRLPLSFSARHGFGGEHGGVS